MLLPPEGSTDFIRPYLDSWVRVRERGVVQPDDLRGQAERLLREAFGERPQPVTSAFAVGHIGIVAEHTYYFDGFALLLPLPFGTAVAVRRAAPTEARCVIEGVSNPLALSAAAETAVDPAGGREKEDVLVAHTVDVLRRAAPPGEFLQAAVVSHVPPFCEDGYLAAVAMAARRALGSGSLNPEDVRRLAGQVEDVVVRPYGSAAILGAAYSEAGHALLVDTLSAEHIQVALPSIELMVWALVDTGARMDARPSVFRQRRDQAAEVVDALLKQELVGPDGIRDLEHRNLQRALSQLPRRLHPVLRYLVTENRRVQRLVVALRQTDPQMFGAFLQMSQASVANDWKERNPAMARVQELAGEVEGVEGVRRVGREFGSGVLLTGRPLAVMPLLDRLLEPTGSNGGSALNGYLV